MSRNDWLTIVKAVTVFIAFALNIFTVSQLHTFSLNGMPMLLLGCLAFTAAFISHFMFGLAILKAIIETIHCL